MKRQHARGVAAMYPGVCDRCEQTYARGDLIVPRGGGYIHVECASGGDEQTWKTPSASRSAEWPTP